jgi:hypothetical protein
MWNVLGNTLLGMLVAAELCCVAMLALMLP